MRRTPNRPLRILASPAWRNREENPYNALLYDAVIDASPGTTVTEYSPSRSLERFDVIHWHWPEGAWNSRYWIRCFARAVLLFAEIDYARSRGASLIWTFHNLAPHDTKYPRLAEWCARQLAKRVDGAVFLSGTSQSRACNRHPHLRQVESVVIQHGDYRPVLHPAVGKRCAREKLGLPDRAKTIGFIGRIRPYKELASLVAAFRAADDPSVRLLIAGEPDDSSEVTQCLAEASNDPRVIFQLGLLSERALQEAVEACDLLVFPNRKVTNSGSMIYALSNNRPVLVPRCECMEELASQASPSSVLFFNGSVSEAALFAALHQVAELTSDKKLNLPSWEQIAQLHIDFYEKVCR